MKGRARMLMLSAAGCAAFALATAGTAAAACPPAGCGITGLPHMLTFSDDRGGLPDRNGVGTGFTVVDETSRGEGFLPDRLLVDRATSRLLIDTTAGLAFRDVDSLDNALGVGLDTGGAGFTLATTLRDVPPVVEGYAQAGLWMGSSEDDYVKLVVLAIRGHQRVQILAESGGRIVQHKTAPLPVGADVVLRLRVDTGAARVTGAYEVNGAPAKQAGSVRVPDSMLHRWTNAAGRRIATGGIFATHRAWSAPLRYAFDDFSATCVPAACAPGPVPEDPDLGDGDPGPVLGALPGAGGSVDAPVPPPTGPGSSPGATSRAVSVIGPRRIRYAILVRRGLRARVRCTGSCRLRARLRVSPDVARKLGLRAGRRTVTLATSTRRTAHAARNAHMVVRPTARVGRQLRHVRAHARATIEVHGAFPTGEVAIARRPVKLVR